MMILTLTTDFPDPDVEPALRAAGLELVANTIGQPDVIQALSFQGGDGTTARYLFEPELEIAVIVFEGGADLGARVLQVAPRVQHMEPLQAALAYVDSASLDVKVTLLRILSAHSLERTTEPMLRVAALAARDPSPFVRLGVVQLLQYAHDRRIADLVRATVAIDPDPDARAFAGDVLARFDSQPVSAARSGEMAYLVIDEPFEVTEEALIDRFLAAADKTGDEFVEDARQESATQTWTRFLNTDGDAALTLWEDREARVRYLEFQMSSSAKLKKAIAAFRRQFATVDHTKLAKRIALAAPEEALELTLFSQLAYSAPATVPPATVKALTAALASPVSARRQGAALAIGTLGFPALEGPLRAALDAETDPAARDAMERASRIFA